MRPLTSAALGLLLLGSGCAGPGTAPGFIANSPGRPWVRTELFFGMSRPGGVAVAPAEWQRFLDDEITPRFPDGLTVLDAAGQWRGASGRVTSEPAKVLILFHPPDSGAGARIEAIRERWLKLFGQESVLRATSPARVSF